jgi:type III secretory pathway component EscU
MSRVKFTKLIIAAALGSLTMFIWGGFSHVVLFTGAGFKPLPNVAAVKEALKASLSQPGLYSFTGKELRKTSTEQEAEGGNPFSRGKLILQFLSSVLSVLIAVQIVSLIDAGYWIRVFTVTYIGLLTCSAVSSMYWNLYVIPTSFFIAQILDMVIGFFLAGLVICRVLSKAGV